MKCVVIIPVYKSLEWNDRIVVKQAVNMTEGIDKVFIMPESFTFDESFFDFKHIPIQRFDNHFFKNITGYNRLMLSLEFYERFSSYDYMLIHHTDAFLFKSDLITWCNKNYDYIGAPWLRPHKIKKTLIYSFTLAICPWIYSHRRRRQIRHYNNVGNGGLSLRKIKSFIDILKSHKTRKILDIYLNKQLYKDSIYNEDVFWSLEGHRLNKNFKKPHWREAIYFSIEMYPSFAFNLMDKQLPFGCHAPLVHGADFWDNYLPFPKKDLKQSH